MVAVVLRGMQHQELHLKGGEGGNAGRLTFVFYSILDGAFYSKQFYST